MVAQRRAELMLYNRPTKVVYSNGLFIGILKVYENLVRRSKNPDAEVSRVNLSYTVEKFAKLLACKLLFGTIDINFQYKFKVLKCFLYKNTYF